MSVKSNGLSRSKKIRQRKAGRTKSKHDVPSRQPIGKPFNAGIRKQAESVASQYQIILENEDGRWYGRGLELPHVFGHATTPQKCIQATRSAMAAAVAYLLERSRRLPSPARAGRRTQQVNVRLTAEEKAVLESIARRKGFQGLSDYLRAAALEST
jgi:predicted RNase H-like HicB family nuclease